MLWKTSLLSSSKLSGLVLGVCLLPIAGASIASADDNLQYTTSSAATAIKTQGIKTAVVAATDTGGDQDIAFRALKAATIGLGRTQGYIVLPADKVASSLKKSNLRWPFVPRQYPEVKKKLDKADRVVAVTVTPNSDPNTYSAVVEMYDTNNGGLVGRGEATYTADAATIETETTTTAPAVEENDSVLGTFPVPAGTAVTTPDTSSTTVTTTTVGSTSSTDSRFLAVDGAILRALDQMNEPAAIDGIVVSLPGGYLARLSKGEMHGLRNGARIEYTVGGRTIAYGTAVDVGKGEALATVAPERAFPLIEVNGEFRSVNNPLKGTAGKSREEFDNKEWSKFENQFGLAAGILAVGYLIYQANN